MNEAAEKIVDKTREHLVDHGALKPGGAKIGVADKPVGEQLAEAMDEKPRKPVTLPHNSLDGFQNGACLDLRVRFAMELLKSPMFGDMFNNVRPAITSHLPSVSQPPMISHWALDIADELFAEADRRGLITPLLDFSDDAFLQAHVERQAKFQALLQTSVQKEAQAIHDGTLKMARAVGGAFGKAN